MVSGTSDNILIENQNALDRMKEIFLPQVFTKQWG